MAPLYKSRLGTSTRPSSPRSPTSPVTSDMISAPLSCRHLSDFDALPIQMLPALEYISNKLFSKMMHLTLVIGSEAPLQISQQSELSIFPIAPLTPDTWRILLQTVEKAARKFSLGPTWIEALRRSQKSPYGDDFLRCQSILQNEVLFSQEGLALLNIDRLYMLKHRLYTLWRNPADIPGHLYISSCVQMLRKTIRDYDGRPFSFAFFRRIYDHLYFPDELLVQVAKNYNAAYGEVGIVLPVKPRTRNRRFAVVGTKGMHKVPPKPGPKTPLSASDVTPITRKEWDLLQMGRKLEALQRGSVRIPVPVKPVEGYI